MNLEEFVEPLAYEAAFWNQALDEPGSSTVEVGEACIEVTVRLRTLAIILLTTRGSTDDFYHNLIRSGCCRRRYLRRVHLERQFQDYFYASGHSEALLDSVAAEDWQLARGIAQLSPSEFRPLYEYEDDYCFSQIVFCLVEERPDSSRISALIDRFASYLGTDVNPCLAVCRALADRDQTAFEEAFADLLDIRDTEIEASKARGQLEEPHVVAQRRVFIEGLAILRLAERRGLRTEREYRYCPSIARVPMIAPFPGE